MTDCTTSHDDNQKPDSVLLGELAVAAGIAGKPVGVCFTELDAAVAHELWLYFARLIGQSRVLHVHSQSDVTRLRKEFEHWRLVIVHVPRLFNSISWIVQSHRSNILARPTVLLRSSPDIVDDPPIPIVVIRNNPDETSAILRWLIAGCPQRAVLTVRSSAAGISFDPALIPVLTPNSLPNGRGPESFADCQLLRALLCGAHFIRGSELCPSESTESPSCREHEYEYVRQVLRSPLLNTAAESIAPLAVEMVQRANVFLQLKSNPDFLQENSTLCGVRNAIHREQGRQTSLELISRGEVADLGNVRSQLVMAITDCLLNQPDGYPRFCEMGLVRLPPSEQEFKGSTSPAIARFLRPWSAKQVRTHFELLRKNGLITGERAAANAPWQYRLPEALTPDSSPFRLLPPGRELFPASCPNA